MSQSVPSASKKSSRVVAMLGRLAALAAVYAFFAILTPGSKGFMSDANTQLMLQDIAVVAMAAIGMTLVIIAGGIDLSAGSSIALAMITTAYVLNLGPDGQCVEPQYSAYDQELRGTVSCEDADQPVQKSADERDV